MQWALELPCGAGLGVDTGPQFLAHCRAREAAATRGLWCFPDPGPEPSALSFGSQGSPSGSFLPGGQVGRPRPAVGLGKVAPSGRGRAAVAPCWCP